jgi:hypothetical protein
VIWSIAIHCRNDDGAFALDQRLVAPRNSTTVARSISPPQPSMKYGASLLRHRYAASDLWVQGRSLNLRKSPFLLWQVCGNDGGYRGSAARRPVHLCPCRRQFGKHCEQRVWLTFAFTASSRRAQRRAEIGMHSATDSVLCHRYRFEEARRRLAILFIQLSAEAALASHETESQPPATRTASPPISKMTSPTPTRSGCGPTSADLMEKRPHACRPSHAQSLRRCLDMTRTA